MFGIALDERFDKSGFAHSWGANDCNNEWWSFFRKTIDQGNVETLFLDLYAC